MAMSSDVRVCTTLDEFSRLRGPWAELTRNAGARSLFLTWDWLHACLQAGVERGVPAIVCVYEGERLIGAAPLVRRRARYYGVPVTETVFLGDPRSDRQFFLDGSDGANATSRIWQFLAANPFRSTLLRLEQVPEESETLARGRTVVPEMEVEVASRLPYVPLKPSWAEFELTLDRKFRSEMRTRSKVFDALGSWQVAHLNGVTVLQHLEEIARVELDSAKSERGHAFFQKPGNMACLRTFIETSAGTDVVPVLSLLRITDRVVAYLLGFLYDRKYHAYNMAFLPEYRKGSPGKFVMHQALRYAHEAGATEFDLLRGEFFMKHEWKPALRQNVRCVRFSRSALGQALRWAVFHLRPRLKRRLAAG
jgi:CelD/BcsL family acetyltransferase involved in cellulose biosynthesis